LEVFERIEQAGVTYSFKELCVVREELAPFVQDVVRQINHPFIHPSLVQVGLSTMMDNVFDRFPSTGLLKYTMDIPLLPVQTEDLSLIFEKADQLVRFENEPVFFLSPDWSPVMELCWRDVVNCGPSVFSDIPVSFLFINESMTKILFKSIEDEWWYLHPD
jgi:hypothetical protein